MPKLYYTPTSCGAASFIAAQFAHVNLEVEQVALATHTTTSGIDFYTINPKGNVPALVLDDGTVLNENAAVLQYIADLGPEGKVAPVYGSTERYQVQNTLNYIASEIHGAMGPLFYPVSENVKDWTRTNLLRKFHFLEENIIGNRTFVVGNSFTIADSYLYIVLSWLPYVNIDLLPTYPKMKAYYDRIAAMEEVQAAHARIAQNPSSIF